MTDKTATDKTDWQLIHQFAAHNTQADFAVLVRRYTNLVYCACRREAGPALADDAVQAVFLVLARRAGSFSPGVALPGWLFHTVRLVCRNLVRQERRRQAREHVVLLEAAAGMQAAQQADAALPPGWADVESLLNDALEALPPAQRDLIVERFLLERPLAEVGAARGLSEDAARMRVNRALGRLHRWFTARNVALSLAALAALLPQAVQPAPAHCAELLSQLLIAEPTAPAFSLAQGVYNSMHTKRLKIAVAAAVLIAALSLGTAHAVRVTRQAKARTVAAAEKQQEEARAQALLNQMYATYAAMHSFRCIVTSREDVLGTAQDAVYEIERPGKIRFHRITLMGEELSGQALAVSDGTSLYVTCTENKGLADRYLKRTLVSSFAEPLSLGWAADFGGLPGWGTGAFSGMPGVALAQRPAPNLGASAPEYSVGPPQTIDFSGVPGPMSLDVVSVRTYYADGSGKTIYDVVTYYIGQQDHLLYKLTAAYNYNSAVTPTKWDTRTELIINEVNPKLNSTDFVFTPPPGSREVNAIQDLFPGGRM